MKNILLVLLAVTLLFCEGISAQVLKALGEKAKSKIGQRANQKVDNAMDKGLDEIEGKKVKKVKEDEDGDIKIKTEDGDKVKIKSDASGTPSLEAYSKYDFVQGEKIVSYEDFARIDVGDFPTNWNTNATAEVVTLNNKEGKWLKFQKEGVWHPEFMNNLPENFTLEFDLGVNNDWSGSHFALNMARLDIKQDFTDFYHYISWRGNYAIQMQLKPGLSGRTGAVSKLLAGTNGNYTVNSESEFKEWDNASNLFTHISMWRQGQRLRVYANGQKIWDIPRAFDATSKFNLVTFAMQGSYRPEDYFLLGNIRLAVGAPDTRNKLLSEGKFVTTGITFDINSDKIKPTSYGVLKQIATALTENADVKIKIIGHTDSDGDDAKNLDLSKRRAASVKAALASEFKIDDARMSTDGLGETKPMGDNKTAEGKAQNRRVEFIKM
jgi:outer membrane protein OmpA-like peptidoglycan-associated protein